MITDMQCLKTTVSLKVLSYELRPELNLKGLDQVDYIGIGQKPVTLKPDDEDHLSKTNQLTSPAWNWELKMEICVSAPISLKKKRVHSAGQTPARFDK